MSKKVTNNKLTASAADDIFKLSYVGESAQEKGKLVHVFGNNVVCKTDIRGQSTPHDRTLTEIVVDSSEGFIPLWAKHTTLRWRFQEQSFLNYENSSKIKDMVKALLGEAILAWGDAAPIKFAQKDDAWDFEIVMHRGDDCDNSGCVLASAFFPDAGRHDLIIYPRMFSQEKKEQVETLAHEIGHIFGLRHFFANIKEKRWSSEIFGKHDPFSIMNYGNKSELTKADRDDLKKLYAMAWSGNLTEINGTPIRLVTPFHSTIDEEDRIIAISPFGSRKKAFFRNLVNENFDSKVKLQKIIASYTPFDYTKILLDEEIMDHYIAKEFKLNFCDDIIESWSQLDSTFLVNEMFVSLKTGQDILELIEQSA